MIRVEEIRQFDELARLADDWSRLLAATPGACYFQTLDWLASYWRHYGPGQQLRVLVVRDSEQVIGIVPLVVSTRGTWPLAVRVLSYPLDDWGTFYGPISAQPDRTLRAAWTYLREVAADWDYIDLRWVPEAGRDAARTGEMFAAAGIDTEQAPFEEVSLVDFAGDWAGYVAARGHKWRVNLRRCERQTAELGTVRYERFRPAAADGLGNPRWDLYDTCEALAQRSWQHHSVDGTTLSHEGIREFLRDAHAAAARVGGVDINLLYLNERPVAFLYSYHYRGHLFGLRRGFDARIETGVGNVLLARTIEDSFRRGDHTFDLGAGYASSKTAWRTSTVASCRWSHFPRHRLRAQAVRLSRGWRHADQEAMAATEGGSKTIRR